MQRGFSATAELVVCCYAISSTRTLSCVNSSRSHTLAYLCQQNYQRFVRAFELNEIRKEAELESVIFESLTQYAVVCRPVALIGGAVAVLGFTFGGGQ